MQIKIKTPKEIEMLRAAGRLAAETLRRAGEMVAAEVSLNEIDHFVHDFTLAHGAYPAPLKYHGYPKSVCLSVNEVVTHGIPSERLLKEGDIVNIDITSRLNGYHGDTSAMFKVGKVSSLAQELCAAAREALHIGMEQVRPGGQFWEIGAAIEEYVTSMKFSVVRDYCGHGIGRGFHEDPLVLHYNNREKLPKMKPGMVFTIEPMINAGGWRVKTLKDGWTSVTVDGSLSAQEEHTVLVVENGYEILTLE